MKMFKENLVTFKNSSAIPSMSWGSENPPIGQDTWLGQPIMVSLIRLRLVSLSWIRLVL